MKFVLYFFYQQYCICTACYARQLQKKFKARFIFSKVIIPIGDSREIILHFVCLHKCTVYCKYCTTGEKHVKSILLKKCLRVSSTITTNIRHLTKVIRPFQVVSSCVHLLCYKLMTQYWISICVSSNKPFLKHDRFNFYVYY